MKRGDPLTMSVGLSVPRLSVSPAHSSTLNTGADRMSTAIYVARRRGGVEQQRGQPGSPDWLQLHSDVKCHSMRLGSRAQTGRRWGRRGGVNHSSTVH